MPADGWAASRAALRAAHTEYAHMVPLTGSINLPLTDHRQPPPQQPRRFVIYHIPYWLCQFRTGHHHERWCRSHHALTYAYVYAYAYAYAYAPAHTRPRPPAGHPQLDRRCRRRSLADQLVRHGACGLRRVSDQVP